MRVKSVVLGAVAGAVMASVLSAPSMASASPSVAPVASAPAPAAAAEPILRPGASGPAVRRLQARLTVLRYDPGRIDGRYGQGTVYAVWAFQKVNGIKPTSTVGRATWRALARPVTVKPFVRRGASNRVEVSLRRQLVVVYKAGKVRLISHTSTGSGQRYCSRGSCQYAITPKGNFRVTRKIKGWRHAALGYLYNPVYFYRGYALHGSKSVPLYPASHGCARLPMHTADLLPRLTPIGMRVYVR